MLYFYIVSNNAYLSYFQFVLSFAFVLNVTYLGLLTQEFRMLLQCEEIIELRYD